MKERKIIIKEMNKGVSLVMMRKDRWTNYRKNSQEEALSCA